MKAIPKKNLRVGVVWWIIAACLNVSAAIVYARHSKPGLAVLWIVIAAFCASLAVCLLRRSRLQ